MTSHGVDGSFALRLKSPALTEPVQRGERGSATPLTVLWTTYADACGIVAPLFGRRWSQRPTDIRVKGTCVTCHASDSGMRTWSVESHWCCLNVVGCKQAAS